MKIEHNKAVSIHYTLTDNDGTILDTSSGREPLAYLHGYGNLIPGMEEGLEGHGKGEKLTLKVSPEKGYGLHTPELVQKVPLSAFGGQKVEPGMQFEAGSENQRYVVTVVEVDQDHVTVDGNHALAGKELNFDVEIVDIREATEDEIAHGHIHGPGGHHH